MIKPNISLPYRSQCCEGQNSVIKHERELSIFHASLPCPRTASSLPISARTPRSFLKNKNEILLLPCLDPPVASWSTENKIQIPLRLQRTQDKTSAHSPLQPHFTPFSLNFCSSFSRHRCLFRTPGNLFLLKDFLSLSLSALNLRGRVQSKKSYILLQTLSWDLLLSR